MGNSIKVSQPHSLLAPEILRTPIPWAYSRKFHDDFSTTSTARWTIPRHQIMEPEYMLSVFLRRRKVKRFKKKIGNGICSSTDLNQNLFYSKFKIFILTCQKKKNLSAHEFQIQNDCEVLQQICNSWTLF